MLKILLLFSLISSLFSKDILVFAPLPTKDIKTIHQRLLPTIKYLEKKLNLKIQMDYNPSYADTIKKFKEGKIDLTLADPLPYIILKKEYKEAIPLVHFKNKEGQVFYTCSLVAFVNTDKNIHHISAKKIALTQPLSTCSYLFVNDILKNSNSNIEGNAYQYLGKQDSAALGVIQGKFDFAGVKSDIAKRYFHLGLEEIATSIPIVNFTLVANARTLSNELITKIKEVLLPVEEKELVQWSEDMKYGSVEATDADFDGLKELLASTQIPLKGNSHGD